MATLLESGRSCARAAAAAILPLVLLGSVASCSGPEPAKNSAANDTAAEKPAADVDFITLSGSVGTTGHSSFVLNTPTGRISVEAVDFGPDQDTNVLQSGDRVQVTGRVDKNLFAENTIQASSVYDERLGKVFFFSPVDEAAAEAVAIPVHEAPIGTAYTGRVNDISDSGFTLGTGTGLVTVDVSKMGSNPLVKQLKKGDRVRVWGTLNIGKNGKSRLTAYGLYQLVRVARSGTH